MVCNNLSADTCNDNSCTSIMLNPYGIPFEKIYNQQKSDSLVEVAFLL